MTRRSRDDRSKFLDNIVRYIDSDGGRNLGRISRDLGIPYQTVLFRMLHLKDKGIGVIPFVDVEKIGLERVRVSFTLNSEKKKLPSLNRFFSSLNESAGLRYYSRSLITRNFDCEFNVPRNKKDELPGLLSELESMGLLSNVTLRKTLWKELIMLKTGFLDYPSGEWDVDFSHLSGDPRMEVSSYTTSDSGCDQRDLLIIKELEIDPWLKVVDLAEKINSPVTDVSYHLNNHVFKKGYIPCFRLQWIGTKEAWSKHRIVGMTLVFEKTSEQVTRHIMAVLTPLPFLWSHMRTVSGDYIVELMIPISQLMEANQYITKSLARVDVIPSEIFLPDWSCSSSFTIPYQMFDAGAGSWTFDRAKALEAISLQLIRAK